jgi:deaminated glutathione amidase
MAFTGVANWETLIRARTIENQVFIIAADQFGKSAKSFECYGHSMIIDPWGTIPAELPDGPGVITAEIDLDHLTKVRAELPALQHRRL